MSVVRRNIIANMLGKGVSALLLFVFVPLYVRYLGAEAYGVVGLFATLQAVFFLADAGLSAAFTREVARLSVLPDRAGELRDICRTFEIVFMVLGLAIALVVISSADLIAHRWVRPTHLAPETISNAIRLMGVAIAFQLPFLAYSGGFTGLQRQLVLNGLNVGSGLLKSIGAVLMLKFVAPSVLLFFVWQAAIGLLQLVIARQVLWGMLAPAPGTGHWRPALLQPIGRFAGGMAAISIVSVVLTQVDKVVLSKLLPLEQFGYYSLASVAASAPYVIAAPIFSAVYPNFIQLVTANDQASLSAMYHKMSQLVAILTIPVGVMLGLFAPEILSLWTRNATTAQYATPIVRVLAFGSIAQGIQYVPYALQLANSWTQLTLKVWGVASLLLIPSLILLVGQFGAIGAAWSWTGFNMVCLVICLAIMHGRLLRGEQARWYVQDIGKPMLATVAVIGGARLLVTGVHPPMFTTALLMAIFASAVLAAVLSASHQRRGLQLLWANR